MLDRDEDFDEDKVTFHDCEPTPTLQARIQRVFAKREREDWGAVQANAIRDFAAEVSLPPAHEGVSSGQTRRKSEKDWWCGDVPFKRLIATPPLPDTAEQDTLRSAARYLVRWAKHQHDTVPEAAGTQEDNKKVFEKLKRRWKAETKFLSYSDQKATNWNYQCIIGMGTSALPLIFEELTKDPDNWFWALRAITRQDPVPESVKGDVPLMVDAWLQWGKEHGYISTQ